MTVRSARPSDQWSHDRRGKAPMTIDRSSVVRIPKAKVVEVANRVNANIERLRGWRSSDVHITGKGMPVRLSGTLAVERPRSILPRDDPFPNLAG